MITDLFDHTDPLRAVSLWQPWASAIAVGKKMVETRSWRAPKTVLGKRIGVHAGMSTKGMYLAAQDSALWDSCLNDLPFDLSGRLPFGCLLGSVVVADCKPVEELESCIYGDYSAGRFGWILEKFVPFKEPVPYKGAQGIFMVELEGFSYWPEEVPS